VKPEEVYLAWAPPDSIWSPWAIPVPFAQIVCVPVELERELAGIDSLAHGVAPESDLAVVLDLSGDHGVRFSLALALRGFRPVPLIDGSPGPDVLGISQAILAEQPAVPTRALVAVDMRQTLRWLCIGAALLPSMKITANASPVFILDSLRTGHAGAFSAEAFDNRWKTFPQDFPSARFLREQGIQRVLLIQDIAKQPSEDLAHVLLRWQEEGISIYASSAAAAHSPQLISVNRPSRFRALWHRALTLVGLRRADTGRFGAWPQGSGGS
jgi:hypothetical protein